MAEISVSPQEVGEAMELHDRSSSDSTVVIETPVAPEAVEGDVQETGAPLESKEGTVQDAFERAQATAQRYLERVVIVDRKVPKSLCWRICKWTLYVILATTAIGSLLAARKFHSIAAKHQQRADALVVEGQRAKAALVHSECEKKHLMGELMNTVQTAQQTHLTAKALHEQTQLQRKCIDKLKEACTLQQEQLDLKDSVYKKQVEAVVTQLQNKHKKNAMASEQTQKELAKEKAKVKFLANQLRSSKKVTPQKTCAHINAMTKIFGPLTKNGYGRMIQREELTRKQFIEEKRLKSISGTMPVRVAFQNDSMRPVKIEWVDYQGNLNNQGSLIQPGQCMNRSSYVSHPFVVSAYNKWNNVFERVGVYIPVRKSNDRHVIRITDDVMSKLELISVKAQAEKRNARNAWFKRYSEYVANHREFRFTEGSVPKLPSDIHRVCDVSDKVIPEGALITECRYLNVEAGPWFKDVPKAMVVEFLLRRVRSDPKDFACDPASPLSVEEYEARLEKLWKGMGGMNF